MMSTESETSDIRFVRAPQRTDDIGCALRSAYSRPTRLPDIWVRLLARLDQRSKRA